LVFLFSLHLKKSICIIVPLAASAYSFIYILRKSFKGYLAAYSTNSVVIFIISIILSPIRVYDSIGRFSTGNEIIAFLFLFFAVISTLALQANRRWFDEIHKQF